MMGPVPQGALAIETMCRLAGVSRAGYYHHWRASKPRQEETFVRDAIQRIALSDRHLGYRRITETLGREGLVVNHKRVLRLMRKDNLLALRRRPFVPVTTNSRHNWHIVPNLARGLELTGVDQLWVADITYIRLREAFVYLAIVLDAFSRRVVGWALEDKIEASLAVAALRMAIASRKPAFGSLVHHSDRGIQYACGEYTDVLEEHGVLASMSRVGNPYDNAKAESFMKTLKQEEVDSSCYRNIHDARLKIGTFVEDVYNARRLHSAIGYRPPAEFEAALSLPSDSPLSTRKGVLSGMGKSTAMNHEAPRASP
jgi:putative transposase